MYKIYFHITPSIEIYSNILDEEVKGEPTESSLIDDSAYSPLRPFIRSSIDLNSALIRQPASTYFGRVKNNAYADDGININDLLIIDHGVAPYAGAKALYLQDGEYVIRHVSVDKDKVSWLTPVNGHGAPVKITSQNTGLIKGVIAYVIKKM